MTTDTSQKLPMTERQLQDAVIELAHHFGWKVMHIYDARRMTGQGWPDLFMVRDRAVAVELKSAKGKVTTEQRSWLWALQDAEIEIHVWRPESWTSGDIERCLR